MPHRTVHALAVCLATILSFCTIAVGQTLLTTADAEVVNKDPNSVIVNAFPYDEGDLHGDGIIWEVKGFPTPDTPGARVFRNGVTHKGYVGIFRHVEEGEIPGLPANSMSIRHALQGEADGDEFGFAVSAEGDITSDGAADVVIGAPGANQGKGKVYVFSAAKEEIVYTLQGENEGDRFGSSVAILGDITGDGHAEFAVGAPYNDAAGANAGRVYVYSGATGELLVVVNGPGAGARFGVYVYGETKEAGQADPDIHVVRPRRWFIHISSDPLNGEHPLAEYAFYGEFDNDDPFMNIGPRTMREPSDPSPTQFRTLTSNHSGSADSFNSGVIASLDTLLELEGLGRAYRGIPHDDCVLLQDDCLRHACNRVRAARLTLEAELRAIEGQRRAAEIAYIRNKRICEANYRADMAAIDAQFDNCMLVAKGLLTLATIQAACGDVGKSLYCGGGGVITAVSCVNQRRASRAQAAQNRIQCLTGANALYASTTLALNHQEDDARDAYECEVCNARKELKRCQNGHPAGGFDPGDPGMIDPDNEPCPTCPN